VVQQLNAISQYKALNFDDSSSNGMGLAPAPPVEFVFVSSPQPASTLPPTTVEANKKAMVRFMVILSRKPRTHKFAFEAHGRSMESDDVVVPEEPFIPIRRLAIALDASVTPRYVDRTISAQTTSRYSNATNLPANDLSSFVFNNDCRLQ
jgi:hypothetical protein